MRSRVESGTNARRSSWWLVPRSCVPVTMASTTRRRLPASSFPVASPRPSRTLPSSVAACSSALTTDVPTATMRPRRARARSDQPCGEARNEIRLVERKHRVQRGVAGRRDSGCVRERRESDADAPRRPRARSSSVRNRPTAVRRRPADRAIGVHVSQIASGSRRYEYWTGRPCAASPSQISSGVPSNWSSISLG